MVEYGAFSHKVNYVTIISEILNLEGHPNRTAGSKVMAILLNVWILPIGVVASSRVCAQPAKLDSKYLNNMGAHTNIF